MEALTLVPLARGVIIDQVPYLYFPSFSSLNPPLFIQERRYLLKGRESHPDTRLNSLLPECATDAPIRFLA